MPLSELKHNFQASITALQGVLDGFGEVVAERKVGELRVGLSGDGRNITPSYSPYYGKYKSGLSTYQANNGTPDTYVSGTYHNSILYTRKGYDFYHGYKSAQPYFSDLEARYSGLKEISPQGEKDLDNKLKVQFSKSLKQIWT